METRLIHLVRTGNEDELALLLGELYRENFEDRDLPIFMFKVFLYDFMGTVVKLTNEPGFLGLEVYSTVLSAVESAQSIEAQYLLLRDRLMAMCHTVRETKQTGLRHRFEEYLAYIDTHYEDSQMSLTILADQFKVTETYLSRCFKENTGFNFFEYLENRRIEHSKKLLVETQIPVGEIAIAVGYCSANTFSRAFKRSVGVSALIYRHTFKEDYNN
jgi:YesN/AraC family two-component response regulator